MQQLGLNSDVQLGEKRLHIQTTFSSANSKIVSNVFHKGRVIHSRELDVPAGQKNGELDSRLKAAHQMIIAEFENIFHIARKVYQVRHPVSCNKLGLVFMKNGLIDEAIASFQLAIETEPGFAEAYHNLGLCYLERKDFERAEHHFRQALERASDFADIVFSLGRLNLERDALGKAYDFFKKCLTLNPKYFAAHYHICLTLLLSLIKGDDDTQLPSEDARQQLILKHLDEAGSAFKPFVSNLSMQARTAFVAGNLREALDFLRRAYEHARPECDMTFDHEFYLKFMYGGKGKDNAFIGHYIDQLTGAIEKQPNFADLHNNLGIAYLIMCRNLFLKALEEFRLALKINPKFKRAEKNLRLAENDGKGFLILLRALLK